MNLPALQVFQTFFYFFWTNIHLMLLKICLLFLYVSYMVWILILRLLLLKLHINFSTLLHDGNNFLYFLCQALNHVRIAYHGVRFHHKVSIKKVSVAMPFNKTLFMAKTLWHFRSLMRHVKFCMLTFYLFFTYLPQKKCKCNKENWPHNYFFDSINQRLKKYIMKK